MIRGWGAGLRAWTLCAALLAQDPGAAAAHAIVLESEPAADGHITEGALRFTVLEPK